MFLGFVDWWYEIVLKFGNSLSLCESLDEGGIDSTFRSPNSVLTDLIFS